MKPKLSSFSIITISICLATVGAWLIPILNVNLTTDRITPTLIVSYSWPNASAKALEQGVTSKLEGLFNAMQGVRDISSNSSKGNGNIEVQFKKGTDIDAIRFEMANLIRQAYPKLPTGVSYPQLSASTASEGQSPILSYSVNSGKSSYYIKKYAEDHILPKLSQLKGVGRVDLFGAAPFEWVITYDADKLFQLQLSVDEVSEAINNHLRKNELGLANYEAENNEVREMSVQLQLGPMQDGISLAKVPVKKIGNRIIYLKDIAQVQFKEGSVNAYYRINGLNTLNMAIYPEKGVNTIDLTKHVKKEIVRLKEKLDNGYNIKLTQDTTAFLVEELKKIQLRTLFSLVILLVLVMVIYRNVKYLLILFLGILINLLIAVIFYYLFNVQLQLYSFAGITISFGVIIDNSIIMIDHVRNKGDRKAFLAILAATLTTIGAILVIFLLEENQRLNLWDFALVIAINIGVSLLVSLYLIPALLDKLNFAEKKRHFSRKRKRHVVKFTNSYLEILTFLKRPIPKWGLLILFIFGFGLPLHLTPRKIEGKGYWRELYNDTLGSEWFVNEVRPTMEKIIGGALRLFTENVFENSYYAKPERTSIKVTGTMPEGCTIEQLNDVIQKMERYIASFDEVSLFETQITSYRNSSISIYFDKEHENGSFPYTLKSLIESRAIRLGGLDWTVSGVGRGFSNTLGIGSKSDRIIIEGYNYDKLYDYAQQLQKQLEETSEGRVRDTEITSGGWNNPLNEYYLDFDAERMALQDISTSKLYGTLKDQLHSGNLEALVNDNELQNVKLVSNKYAKFNVWDLKNSPILVMGNQYKLMEMASISKRKTGNNIWKVNQQYRLAIIYDFIGTRPLAQKFRIASINEFSSFLPVGYKVFEKSDFWWDKEDKQQYYYLFIIVVIIFFICSILLESLKQPLAIISLIPLSFIGAFLTFYLFDLNFDQGGYASFVLLSGISVNSALYIINDYNNLKSQYPDRDFGSLYFKAFNNKIIPVILTIISTIAGLIPFIFSGQNEVFWFSFASGSIGGLMFSLIGILVYLPLFILNIDSFQIKKNVKVI